MDNNSVLYLVVFKEDNTANFYKEDMTGNLKPLFESKMIDASKIKEKCASNFMNGMIDCDTRIMINGIPERVSIKKIFPSNLDGRAQFEQLMEEHQANHGGSKRRKSLRRHRRHSKSNKNSKRRTRRNKSRRRHYRK